MKSDHQALQKHTEEFKNSYEDFKNEATKLNETDCLQVFN